MNQVLAQIIAGCSGVAATLAAKYLEVWLARRAARTAANEKDPEAKP